MTDVKTILEGFPFLKDRDNDDYDYYGAKRIIIDNVVLPAFYTFNDPTPVYTLKIDSTNGIRVTILDANENQIGDPYTDIVKAYDYVGNILKGDVVFSGDLKAITGSDRNSLVTVPTKDTNGREFHRLLLSHTDDDEIYLAKSSYLYWLESTLAYEANPNDFMTAWYWVDSHPAFWSRYKEGSNDWSMNNNSNVWVGVTAKDTGETVIMLETGAAIEPARTSHYHDLRLDVYAPTYEEAFVKLAALVHKFFDIDGSERENVSYEKSKLELLLDERMKEANIVPLDVESFLADDHTP